MYDIDLPTVSAIINRCRYHEEVVFVGKKKTATTRNKQCEKYFHFCRTSKSTHPYQRERVSITGLRFELRKSM